MAALAGTPIGAVARLVLSFDCLKYQEEKAGFQVEELSHWLGPASKPSTPTPQSLLGANNRYSDVEAQAPMNGPGRPPVIDGPPTNILEKETEAKGAIIVGWYGDDDPAKPHNWSTMKKGVVVLIINLASFAIYMASAIYTPSQPGIQKAFNISVTHSTLGLGVFILGYGIGPLLWSPLSEIPTIGRNIPYIISISIFIIISVPTALSQSMEVLLALRFLQGFFGSPVLSTGGASLSDIADSYTRPYALYTWAIGSLAGPCVGTVVAGYTVPRLGWRWSLWEILFFTAPVGILLLFLPETSGPCILSRRAKRLRKATGDNRYVSDAGADVTSVTTFDRLKRSLVIPWKVNLLDFSIMFTSIYVGLIYAIFFSFFEFFPVVFGGIYGMSQGETGLLLLCNIVAVVVAGLPYFIYIHYAVNRTLRAGGTMSPEERLLPALCASVFVPAGIFLFAWTSRDSIHWMVPVLGASFATGGFAIILQSIFVYISLGYPHYAASLFSGNGLVKALFAFGGVLWSHPLNDTMGSAKGMSILGALCALCVSGIFILYSRGENLRKRSRFAE